MLHSMSKPTSCPGLSRTEWYCEGIIGLNMKHWYLWKNSRIENRGKGSKNSNTFALLVYGIIQQPVAVTRGLINLNFKWVSSGINYNSNIYNTIENLLLRRSHVILFRFETAQRRNGDYFTFVDLSVAYLRFHYTRGHTGVSPRQQSCQVVSKHRQNGLLLSSEHDEVENFTS